MSLKILIGIVVAAGAVFAISGGAIQKAKDFFKTNDTDKTPAVQGGSQPTRSDASIEQMPLTTKELQTSEIIKKVNTGSEEFFKSPDDLPRNTSDLSRFDVTGLNTVNAQKASATLTPQQQKGAQTLRELAIPNEIKYSTSLAGSVPTTGVQLKREEPVVITNAATQGGSSALQQKIILEQQRAEVISKTLYGDVSNPNFVKATTPVTTVPNTIQPKPQPTTTVANPALQAALARGATSAEAKRLLAEAQARKK